MSNLFPTSDFYKHVPKQPAANYQYRRLLLQNCYADRGFMEEVYIACKRDILFYINSFGWLLEPRDRPAWQVNSAWGNNREIPFITRPYQDEIILQMQADLGKRDIGIEKSRETGVTWKVLYLFDHSWRFEPQSHYGVVSKDEDSVDKGGDQGSLMVKLDFIDKHLPYFLQPGGDSRKFRTRLSADHVIRNDDNGSTITGVACTSQMFRGGRMRAIFMDEHHAFPPGYDVAAMASTQYVTHCRISCSTYNGQRGQSGAFYDLMQAENSDMLKLRIHWSRDPEKAAGLYEWDGEKIVIHDTMYPFPTGYQFVKDAPNKKRSPYYDAECRRPGASPRSIASELDMDAGGATARFFDPATIALARLQCREPDLRAKLIQTKGFWQAILVEDPRGPIELWFPEDFLYRLEEVSISNKTYTRIHLPSAHSFQMGCDIAEGLGGNFASYSAAVIIDRASGHQVAEWQHLKITPPDYAEFAAALGEAFNFAEICPECTGPGLRFTTALLELGYKRMWLRPQSQGRIYTETSKSVGWDNKDGGLAVLGELQHGMVAGRVHIHSHRVIRECERYFQDELGKLKHPLIGKGRVDAPERSHGDSAIAAAICWWSMHSQDAVKAEEEAPPPELDCTTILGRRMYWEEKNQPEIEVPGWDGDEPRRDLREIYGLA